MRRGFSLMETLVVVALVGLLAGGTLWTGRAALDRRAAAAAAAGLARLDRDARKLAGAASDGSRLAALVAGGSAAAGGRPGHAGVAPGPAGGTPAGRGGRGG